MILIGSRALNLRCPKLLSRKPLDFDFVCTRQEYEAWHDKNISKINPTKIYEQDNKIIIEADTPCEFEIIGTKKSSELLDKHVREDKQTIETAFGLVPSLDMLFTIKSSHKYLKNSPHFWKTCYDYHSMKACGAKIRNEWKDFYKLREKETYALQKHPKLNVNKSDFFKDDNIQYVYDHDDIHKAVALFERPAYTYYMKDGSEVMSDKHKFFALDENIRLAGICEEACTLALERSLVPFKGMLTTDQAFYFALSKVATSITSGWFRDYSFDNVFNAIDMYKKSYISYYDNFKKELNNGKIKKYSYHR